MATLTKVLITVSSILGVLFVWITIKNIQFKAFLDEVKADLADGKVTADEAVNMIAKFFAIFKF
jgi:hypothetical protein